MSSRTADYLVCPTQHLLCDPNGRHAGLISELKIWTSGRTADPEDLSAARTCGPFRCDRRSVECRSRPERPCPRAFVARCSGGKWRPAHSLLSRSGRATRSPPGRTVSLSSSGEPRSELCAKVKFPGTPQRPLRLPRRSCFRDAGTLSISRTSRSSIRASGATQHSSG
jgi:hypothetical protein